MKTKLTVIAVCAGLLLTGSAASQECYESTVVTPSPFMGNNGEIFKLADGSLWEVKYEYEYLYEYQPDVIICPGRGKLAINGKMLNVELVGGSRGAQRASPPTAAVPSAPAPAGSVIESNISGEFKGWDGETIFRLANGQIWQQSTYAYTYTYMYGPRVMIFRMSGGYEMQVEGMNERIRVVRLK